MSSQSPLTATFLERVPKSAARVIEGLAIDESSALIETLPARLTAPVLGEMIPWHGARLLERLSPPRAASLLRELGIADGTSLARLMRPESLESVAEELPGRFARRLRSALGYPMHQVGAWIDPDVPTLSMADSVGDAMRILRAGQTASHIFVVATPHGEYVGMVPVLEVLRSEPAALVEQLGLEKIRPISNRATLSSVTFDNSWDESLHLPVIGRRGNLLGGLSRRTLRKALHDQHLQTGSHDRSMLGHMIGALAVTCVGTLGVLARAAGFQPEHSKGDVNSGR